MDPVQLLTYIAVILLVGIILSALAARIRLPDVLLFIIFGMVLGAIRFNGERLYQFPVLFIASLSILALAMIVFESTTRIKVRQLDSISSKAMRLIFWFFCIEFIFLTVSTFVIFKTKLTIAALFSTIMVGTAPSVVLPLLQESKSKVVDILRFESIINTPFTVLLPFLVLDIITSVEKIPFASTFIEQIGPFLAKFVSGIGAGMLIGIILIKVIKRSKSKLYSPLAVLISALLAYVLAENLGGNGVLSVTTLGLFFGNVYLKEKVELLSFESVLAKSLHILVFVLIGSLINIPFTLDFLLKATALFAIYIVIRYAAVTFAFRKEKYTERQKIFMSLVCPKGIAVAVVAIVFSSRNIAELSTVLDLSLFFIIISIVLSATVCWMQKFFLAQTS